MKRFKAGCCGDYCGKCPNYPDHCPGCVPELKSDCKFVACCLNRRVEHCGCCRDFPCQMLQEFVPDDRPGCYPGYHIDNLRDRLDMGLDHWLEKEHARWRHLTDS